MPNKIERRNYPLKNIRADEEEGSITGHAAVFDKLSVPLWGFREKIEKGAFANTIKEEDVRALWNHDSNYVLGRNRSGTLTLKEDDQGLLVSIEPPDAQWARDFMASIKRGDVDQMSFGFDVVTDEWDRSDKDNIIRTLKEVKLWDVSPVAFPAYPQTDVQARSEVFADSGLNFEALSGVLFRLQRGLDLTDLDRDIINNTVEVLTSHVAASDDDGRQRSEKSPASPSARERKLLLMAMENEITKQRSDSLDTQGTS